MTREEAIEYFKFHRKIFCEDYLKICPKDSIAYQATLKEKEFYDMVIKALEQEPTTKNDLGVDRISRAYLLDDSKYHTVFNDDTGNFEDVVYREDIEKAPSVTPQEPRWIPVTERLPEERHSVLVWCPVRKNIYCACYEEKQWWIFGAYWEKITEEIIAWQPLPKPYKESEGV